MTNGTEMVRPGPGWDSFPGNCSPFRPAVPSHLATIAEYIKPFSGISWFRNDTAMGQASCKQQGSQHLLTDVTSKTSSSLPHPSPSPTKQLSRALAQSSLPLFLPSFLSPPSLLILFS